VGAMSLQHFKFLELLRVHATGLWSMMIISYYLGNKYYPIPYDLKKGAISRYRYFFSRIVLWFQRELLCWNRFINRVPIFYLSQ
jgi:hypothetical protein